MSGGVAEIEKELLSRISARSAVVGVIGLGYVGLPLVLEFHRAGFPVIGFDIDPEKIERLRAGESYIKHISEDRLGELLRDERFTPTTDFSRTKECDALILCVPTPLTKNREPDISYVANTCAGLAGNVRRGQLYCLESTTYPGTTDEVVVPTLNGNPDQLVAGEDFFVAYSPEREDPNNREYTTSTIPKVVGGCTPESLRVAQALYDTVVVRTVAVSSCAAAEATKLMENIFRCVNIAMVNELKMVFHAMGIDIWEVIEAAKTKPFGYMPFYPGPGLGGHCIPIDPFYLTWKAREFEMPTKFIELAGEVNTEMPHYVVSRIMEALNDESKPLRGSRILLVGLAYKADVDDLRESPTLKLIDLLEQRGAKTIYHDPHIPEIRVTREYPHLAGRASVSIGAASECDAVVICTAHGGVDHAALAQYGIPVIDTRNAMSGTSGAAHVYKA